MPTKRKLKGINHDEEGDMSGNCLVYMRRDCTEMNLNSQKVIKIVRKLFPENSKI
jgi:hypothetical protein